MEVAILTEGTYPFFKGGVSTWVHNLISNMPEFNFVVISVVAMPGLKPAYKLPGNVKRLLVIPLWGSEYALEYTDIPLSKFIRLKRNTDETSIKKDFLPHFEVFLENVKSGGGSPKKLGEALLEMHNFLSSHSFEETLRSKSVWEAFLDRIGEDSLYNALPISTLIEIAKIISHTLRILAFPIPRADIFHSTAASLCGVLGVIARLKHGTPYLVTEHGVYFRERLLDLVSFTKGLVGKIFWINFFRSIVKLNYQVADKVVPVCKFNVNWEEEFGVPSWKVEVVYNGVDIERFKPLKHVKATKPLILVMARVDKLKDIANVIEAMKYVVGEEPEAICEIFGPIDDKEYYEYCLKLLSKLKLNKNVKFKGVTERPEVEYNRALIVVQPSLTEGFPLTVVEAMACGKLVVATDVGGVKEAIGDCGLLVPPRSPRKLAQAILKGLKDTRLRKNLEVKARERVCRLFTHKRFIEDYKRVYIELLSEKKLRW